MSADDPILRLICRGDTLEGLRQLLAARQDGESGARRLNRALYGPSSAANRDRIEQERRSHLARLPAAQGAERALLLHNLGCLALYQDEVLEARERFQEVLSLQPEHRFARHNLAYAEELLAEYDQAQEQYDRVLQQDPGFALSRLNRALLRVQTGDVAAGVADLRAMHENDPDNMGILLYLCRALLTTGNPHDAQAVLDVLEAGSGWVQFLDLRECRSYALFVQGRQEEAEAAFRDLIAAMPGNLFSRLGLIKTLAAQGRFGNLAAELEAYEALQPPESVQALIDETRAL
jgi:predicted Zn-dependent protease